MFAPFDLDRQRIRESVLLIAQHFVMQTSAELNMIHYLPIVPSVHFKMCLKLIIYLIYYNMIMAARWRSR